MAKFNYASLDEIPKNVMDFYWATSRIWENDAEYSDPESIGLTTVEDVNDFLNDLDEWYKTQQLDIEYFLNV